MTEKRGRKPKARPEQIVGGTTEVDFTRSLGARVADARSQRGWTPQDLAMRAGVSAVTVRAIELGSKCPKVYTVYRLALALGVSAGYLGFGG